ncbi:hypothetical protein ES702_01749 [subsurface metagenome]
MSNEKITYVGCDFICHIKSAPKDTTEKELRKFYNDNIRIALKQGNIKVHSLSVGIQKD